MTVSKTLIALFKDIFTGMTLYGIGVAMAHGAFIEQGTLCHPTYCDPAQENYNESN